MESRKAGWEEALRAWPSEAVWQRRPVPGDLEDHESDISREVFPQSLPYTTSGYIHISTQLSTHQYEPDDHLSDVSRGTRYNTTCLPLQKVQARTPAPSAPAVSIWNSKSAANTLGTQQRIQVMPTGEAGRQFPSSLDQRTIA